MQLNKTKEKTIEDIKKELELKKISHPFEDDLLDLKPFAETISNIVVSTKDPFVFSINSPYGTGKTFFLRRLHCLLEQKGCMCVSYNAWESDFYDNPLPAIISALERQTLTQKIIDTSKQTIKNISKTSLNPLKKIIEEISILFERKEKIYDDFKKYQEAKEKFIKDLSNFVKNKKLVFIIDELDRCRPDYAIKTLEVIKHFFNIPNIVFIIGVDRKQIESTVKVLYGANIDNNCDEYLRKFIDQDFYLPHTKIENYIWKLCEEHLKPVVQIFIRENLETYTRPQVFSILNMDSLSHLNDAYLLDAPNNNARTCLAVLNIILEYVCALSEFFNFSLRTQEQFILFLKMFFLSLDMRKDPLYPELACLLTAIRLNDYNKISKYAFDEILKDSPSKFPTDSNLNKLLKQTKFGGDMKKLPEYNSVSFWERVLVYDNSEFPRNENEILLAQYKTQADKYLNIIKQLTILTTENK